MSAWIAWRRPRYGPAMLLGDLRIDPIIDGEGRFKPMMSFRGTSEEDWAPHRDLLDDDGLLPFVMGGFLVRYRDRVTLVDLGLGTGRLMGIRGGAMLDNLRAVGVTPEDVTDVAFTHLHEDHIGWCAVDGTPTFRNATYRASSADVHHFLRVDTASAENAILQPIADRLVAWEPGDQIAPGLDTLAAPGHTPGSTIIVASDGTQRAMMLGDVVHCPVQLLDDEWGALFDVDPVLARKTRVALAQELEDGDAMIAAAHFPGLQFGRLIRGEGRRRWVI